MQPCGNLLQLEIIIRGFLDCTEGKKMKKALLLLMTSAVLTCYQGIDGSDRVNSRPAQGSANAGELPRAFAQVIDAVRVAVPPAQGVVVGAAGGVGVRPSTHVPDRAAPAAVICESCKNLRAQHFQLEDKRARWERHARENGAATVRAQLKVNQLEIANTVLTNENRDLNQKNSNLSKQLAANIVANASLSYQLAANASRYSLKTVVTACALTAVVVGVIAHPTKVKRMYMYAVTSLGRWLGWQ